MKVLLTGCAGFIGINLTSRLLNEGYEVIGVDNFITSSPENIKQFKSNPNFRFIEHDISLPLHLDEQVSWILHFASPASPVHYLKYPIKTLKAGLLGTYNCCGIAKLQNAKLLFASTSEVYGDPTVHPQREEYWGNVNTTGPRSCYDESKRAAEALIFAYKRQHNVDVKVIRIFNTYGPFMQPDDGRVISNFIVQALRGEKLTVYGDGSQTRSFCYIDDLIEGIMRFMHSDFCGPINFGNPNEYRILEVAEIIKEITGATSEIEFFPLPEDDPKRRCPDITKAKELLKWEPVVPLEEGLKKTIEYFRGKIRNA